MTRSEPSAEVRAKFERIQGRFILTVLAAAGIWLAQDPIASFAPHQMAARTEVWMPDAWNDDLVVQAFEKSRNLPGISATLEIDPNGLHPKFHDHLTVIGPSKAAALDGRREIVNGMREELARAGKGTLNSDREGPYADAVPNDTTNQIKSLCRMLAAAVLLCGLFALVVQWQRAKLPIVALFGALAAAFTVLTAPASNGGRGSYHFTTPSDVIWGFLFLFGVPAGFVGLIVHLTLKARRARNWSQGVARITRCELASANVRAGGIASKPPALSVSYEFAVGSKRYQGDRVGVGLGPNDGPVETAKRYPVGAEVPVYFDPNDPRNCLLERELPIGLGWICGGTAALLAAYGVLLWRLWR